MPILAVQSTIVPSSVRAVMEMSALVPLAYDLGPSVPMRETLPAARLSSTPSVGATSCILRMDPSPRTSVTAAPPFAMAVDSSSTSFILGQQPNGNARTRPFRSRSPMRLWQLYLAALQLAPVKTKVCRVCRAPARRAQPLAPLRAASRAQSPPSAPLT